MSLQPNTSKFDNITWKELIHSGCPSIYQLTPKKSEIGDVRRLTLGKRNPEKVHKTILLVGETGAGKSTLINALVNFAMGVTWEDKIWFEIVEKEEKRDQYESQTSDVTVYEIFGFEDQTLPYSLTIIDSPGYGDTKGTDKDSLISKRLFKLYESEGGVYEMNAVGLVLKSSDNRLSDRMRYIFDSVLSLFGKDMKENIVALITHSDGRKPKDALKALEAAKIKCAMDVRNYPVHFLFNNCQNTERHHKNSKSLEASWDITQRGMIEFTDFLKKVLPQNLKITADVLYSRDRLTACIQNLKERVKEIELQQEEIQQTKEALKKHEEEMNNDENFKVEVEEPYKEKEDAKYSGRWGLFFYDAAVTCNKCQENCHRNGCTVAWYPRDCEVMRKGHCTVCTGKCPVSDHVKEEKTYEPKTRPVSMTLKDVKEKYDTKKAVGEEEKRYLEDLAKAKLTLEDTKKKLEDEGAQRTSVLNKLETEMEELEKKKKKWLVRSYEHILKLEENALNVNSLSILVHLDFLIEKMSENRDGPDKDKFSGMVKKLEEMRSRVDGGLKGALQYKRTTQGKADEV